MDEATAATAEQLATLEAEEAGTAEDPPVFTTDNIPAILVAAVAVELHQQAVVADEALVEMDEAALSLLA